jgi:hypothetical protein
MYNAQTVAFANEKGSVVVTVERFIWNLTVLKGKIYLLYPGGQMKVVFLRKCPTDAGFTSGKQKNNEVNPV